MIMYSKGIFGSYLYLPVEDLKTPVNRLKSKLTARPKYAELAHIPMYDESREGYFGIPRYYGITADHIENLEYEVSSGIPAEHVFTSQLRENQKPLYDKFIVEVDLGKTGFILKARTGAGKTCMLLKFLEYLGSNALIIVPTTSLLTQWQDMIVEHTSYSKSDIGHVQADIVDYKDKPITISLIQSACKDKYGEDFKKHFGIIVYDELHRTAAEHFSSVVSMFTAKYRIGCSVGGDSVLLVRRNKNTIFAVKIKDFYYLFNKSSNSILYETRAFNGYNFVWKSIENVYKHVVTDKKVYKIECQKGISIIVTEDHSVYKIVSDGYYFKNGSRKYYGKIIEAQGSELKVEDFLLLEDKWDTDNIISHIEIYKYFDVDFNWYVAGDYINWINVNITNTNNYKDSHKIRYQRRNGRWGAYVNKKEFLNNIELRRKVGKVYTEGGSSNWTATVIPVEALAYIIGYYLGDGYISNCGVGFCVNVNDVDKFIKEIENGLLKFVNINPKIYKKKGYSVEVVLHSKVLSEFFRGLFGDAKAETKFIPNEVFSFSDFSIREVERGMRDSDGYTGFGERNRVTYTTVSKKLAEDLVILLRRINVNAGIYTRNGNRGGVIGGRQIHGRYSIYAVSYSMYQLSGENSGKKGHRYKFDMRGIDGNPIKILKITEIEEPFVYDISIDDKKWKTFLANGILVHNSATLKRQDGMDVVFKNHIGETIISLGDEREEEVRPKILVIGYKGAHKFIPGWTYGLPKINKRGVIISSLIKDNLRNNMIISNIIKLALSGRRILVLSDRIEQLNFLLDRINPLYKPGLFISTTIKEEKQRVLQECGIILSTFGMFSTGMDVPDLAGLVIATPQSHIRQAVGRISRLYKGKKRPVIVDIVDNDIPECINWYGSRVSEYKHPDIKGDIIIT